MAHVRKVTHRSGRQAWQATVITLEGKRKSKNFARKGDAEAWIRQADAATATGAVGMTVLEMVRAHNRWFDTMVEAGERDRRTADGYDTHLRIHLKPDMISRRQLSDLSTPLIHGFLERAIERAGSVEIGRRLKRSFVTWCKFGMQRGWLRDNPATGTKILVRRRRHSPRRVQLPEKDALAALLRAAHEGPAPERDTAVVYLLMFCGLRISEMLGLADDAVELGRKTGPGVLHVDERLCSRYGTLGGLKSEQGQREIPVGGTTAMAVRAWRLARGPVGPYSIGGRQYAGRLFPGSCAASRQRYGHVWYYPDFRRECWGPLLVRAGLGRLEKDYHGAKRAKVDFAPHTLRHVYASIQIDRGVAPKRLQELLGHATMSMTMDRYGHLWSDPLADQAMANAAEQLFLKSL